MSDEYDVTVERTGRLWHRVVLTWNPATTWIVMEAGHWSVPGRRWALWKARRVMRGIVRSEGYRREGRQDIPQRGVYVVTTRMAEDYDPPSASLGPPMSQ